MVSFSTPNGGVGAHLDQYDVFIVQGSGKRHWQVGAPDNTLTNLEMTRPIRIWAQNNYQATMCYRLFFNGNPKLYRSLGWLYSGYISHTHEVVTV